MQDPTPNKSCLRCLELERQVAALTEQLEQFKSQVADLTKQLEENARARKRQAAPFRRGKKVGEKKKPGRKPGHQAESRPEPPPEQVQCTIHVPAEVCPQCQTALEDVTTHVQFQTDIPPVQPVVTQFNVQVGFCPCCQMRVQGQHPEQTSQALGAAGNTLGPRAIATAADMKYRLGIPFRKIADFFEGAFHLPCSAAGLCRATQRLAQRSEGVLEVLKMQLPGRKVVHGDETSWWLDGEKTYLHVFAAQDEDLVIFQVGDRSNGIALDLLGPHFAGRLECDGYVGYDIFPTARCNAHPIRRVRDLLESGVSDQATLEEIQQLLQGGLELRDRREELSDRGYQRLVTIHKGRVHDWIENNRQHDDQAIGRLARHLGKYEEEFLLYLDDPDIPATNNFGEGLLRFAVVLRKIGCCNRSERGVSTFEILASLLATFRRRGLDFAQWAMELLKGSGPKYVPPDLLPPGCELQILLNA